MPVLVKVYPIMPIIMATLCLAVASFELLAWARMKRQGYNLAFAVICLAAAAYNVACGGAYNVTSPLKSVIWLRTQAIALNLVILAFFWYSTNTTHTASKTAWLSVFSVGAFFILCQLVATGDLVWDTARPLVIRVALPFGRMVTYAQVEPGALTQAQYFLGVGFFVYVVQMLVRHYRRTKSAETLWLLWMCAVLFAAIMNDFAVSTKLYAFLYLLEYAWLIVVVFVGLQRSRLLVEAAATLRALEDSERRYRAIFESLQDVYFRADSDGILELISPSIRAFGTEPEALVGRPVSVFSTDEGVRRTLYQALKTRGYVSNFESTLWDGESHLHHVSINAHSLFDEKGTPGGIEGTFRDISDRKRAEEAVLASLQEKSILLGEIHHRVKDNLQIISSLLYLQQARLFDDRDRGILQDCRNQVTSMALVHEDLYGSKDFRNVNVSAYLKKLVDRLISVFHRNDDVVALVPLVQNLGLAVDKAVPCGLIVNELCTNALKHAFPRGAGGRKWELQVELKPEREKVSLVVADNGVGLPNGLDPSQAETLGLQIVGRLVKQLHGTFVLESGVGTRWVIEFAPI